MILVTGATGNVGREVVRQWRRLASVLERWSTEARMPYCGQKLSE